MANGDGGAAVHRVREDGGRAPAPLEKMREQVEAFGFNSDHLLDLSPQAQFVDPTGVHGEALNDDQTAKNGFGLVPGEGHAAADGDGAPRTRQPLGTLNAGLIWSTRRAGWLSTTCFSGPNPDEICDDAFLIILVDSGHSPTWGTENCQQRAPSSCGDNAVTARGKSGTA